MVVVLAGSVYPEVAAGGIAQRLEEMLEHFRRHVSDIFAGESDIPDELAAAAEVEQHERGALVHRQGEAVALDASLVAEGGLQGLTEGDADVLHSVMLIDLEIALAAHREGQAAMVYQLGEHVVEELESRINLGRSAAVKVQTDVNVRLGRFAGDHGAALRRADALDSLAPAVLLRDDDGRCAEIARQLHVRLAVADNETCRHVVVIGKILAEHACPGLAGRKFVLRETPVNQEVVEVYAFPFQSLEHQVVGRPEGALGE